MNGNIISRLSLHQCLRVKMTFLTLSSVNHHLNNKIHLHLLRLLLTLKNKNNLHLLRLLLTLKSKYHLHLLCLLKFKSKYCYYLLRLLLMLKKKNEPHLLHLLLRLKSKYHLHLPHLLLTFHNAKHHHLQLLLVKSNAMNSTDNQPLLHTLVPNARTKDGSVPYAHFLALTSPDTSPQNILMRATINKRG